MAKSRPFLDLLRVLIESGLLADLIPLLLNKPKEEQQAILADMRATDDALFRLLARLLDCLIKQPEGQQNAIIEGLRAAK